jgi:hypothetical protein
MGAQDGFEAKSQIVLEFFETKSRLESLKREKGGLIQRMIREGRGDNHEPLTPENYAFILRNRHVRILTDRLESISKRKFELQQTLEKMGVDLTVN